MKKSTVKVLQKEISKTIVKPTLKTKKEVIYPDAGKPSRKKGKPSGPRRTTIVETSQKVE